MHSTKGVSSRSSRQICLKVTTNLEDIEDMLGILDILKVATNLEDIDTLQ